ncbi:MAG TPA: hypothetical protein VIU11_11480 [Nakamurella sp.]
MTATPPDPPTPWGRPELLDLYRESLAEYRFQAQFNWSRAQYWLVFNAGILTAGVALLAGTHSRLVVIVFVIGVVCCLLSARAVQVAHLYYRASRDRVSRLERELHVPAAAPVDTTRGFTGGRRPRVNVQAVVYLLLASLAGADVVAAVLSFMA